MSSETNPKTIELYGVNPQHEAEAGGAITPGMLIERTSTGTVRAHSTQYGGGNSHFAIENRNVGNGIDDAYASGDNVMFATGQCGHSVYALVPAAAAAISVGDMLVSNGDGTLIAHPATGSVSAVQVAQALEAVDNSGGASVARIKVELIPNITVTGPA